MISKTVAHPIWAKLAESQRIGHWALGLRNRTVIAVDGSQSHRPRMLPRPSPPFKIVGCQPSSGGSYAKMSNLTLTPADFESEDEEGDLSAVSVVNQAL